MKRKQIGALVGVGFAVGFGISVAKIILAQHAKLMELSSRVDHILNKIDGINARLRDLELDVFDEARSETNLDDSDLEELDLDTWYDD